MTSFSGKNAPCRGVENIVLISPLVLLMYRQDYQSALFGAGVVRSPSTANLDAAGSDADSGCDVSASASSSSSSSTRNHSLCLSVSVPELLQAAQADTV